MTQTKLDSIEDTRRGDKWFFMFEVFVNWTYRNKDNQRRVRFFKIFINVQNSFSHIFCSKADGPDGFKFD